MGFFGDDRLARYRLRAGDESPPACPGYRLPTEAEWEYAARAGSDEATYNGDLDRGHLECEQPNYVLNPIAWYCGNAGDRSHKVALKEPNDFGLYDMLGNVWEWCHDWFGDYDSGGGGGPWGPEAGSGRVFRGGSWYGNARHARAADRFFYVPGSRNDYLGFRLVRTVFPP